MDISLPVPTAQIFARHPEEVRRRHTHEKIMLLQVLWDSFFNKKKKIRAWSIIRPITSVVLSERSAFDRLSSDARRRAVRLLAEVREMW